ncbi:cholinesterase 2-like isoform X5 [Dreissena polymorpha]|uniref:cholinesterase 2-like isoform X5 n=1 Tax=Dreissena polymorpha TaxID=45954 RepID=UPI00226567A1|nr:cholinesterase 2-like isoform X5 [Dreissena polymorpha]
MFDVRFRESFCITIIAAKFGYVDCITIKKSVGAISGVQETLIVDGRQYRISKFLGIPFEESTAGENRFHKPLPNAPFSSTFDATQNPMACFPSHLGGEIKYGKYVNFTEDCLNLNVFVPHTFEKNVSLPVMIWIYGGSFVEGAAAIYPGEGISAFGEVIVVTVNYRLGMFGFIQSADGKLPGNQGLWDQHLGIKWVHDNILAFTGNPKDVTIFGKSAGGASVIFQSLYPGNRGFFQRVIAQSGSALAYWAVHATPNAEPLIAKKGCERAPDPVKCLRALTPRQLQDDDTSAWQPVIDRDFLLASPQEIIFGNSSHTQNARNFFASLDLMTGANNFDGAVYFRDVWPFIFKTTDMNTFNLTRGQFTGIAIPSIIADAIKPKNHNIASIMGKLLDFEYTDWQLPNDSTTLLFSLTNMSNDVGFFYPVVSTVKGHAALRKGKTYLYQLSAVPTTHTLQTPNWIQGSNHADDIQYVFGYPLYAGPRSTGNYTEEERRLARGMVTMWTNFAKSGDPNQSEDARRFTNATWAEYDLNSQSFLHFTNQGALPGSRFEARRMQLWLDLIPTIALMETPQALGTGTVHVPEIIIGK